MKIKLLILLCFITSFIYSQSQYVITQKGNIPVLLSAPHGGNLKPSNLIDRTGLDFKTDADANTKEILLAVEKELTLLWGKPSCVYSNLHRSKIDFNREINEATDSNETKFFIYNMYHDFIKAQCLNQNKYLVIDIHGHTHPENLIELGYNVNLNKQPKNSIYWSSKSFGYLFNLKYGKAICYPPINNKPSLYYDGGYITKTKYGNEFHIQIELPSLLRKKSDTNKIAKMLAKNIYEFYKLNFNE